MLTMRPVRLRKNFPRELVNTSLKKKALDNMHWGGLQGIILQWESQGPGSFIGHILSIIAAIVNSI